MIVAADYGDATIAYCHDYGIEYSTTLSEELGGKREIKEFEKNKAEFLKSFFITVNELAKVRKIKTVLIGATGMMIDYLKSKAESYDYLKGKTYFSKINYSNKNGIKELVNSGEAEKIIKQSNYFMQSKLVEKLLEMISKSKKSTYGYNFVKKAVNEGAVSDLLITTRFISKSKEEKKYIELNNLLKLASDSGASINILSSETEPGEQIDNLSGITAILRYDLKE
jgi:protein pelota